MRKSRKGKRRRNKTNRKKRRFIQTEPKKQTNRIDNIDKSMHEQELAKQLFGLPLDEDFMPHLSLLYGDFSVDEKERIIKNLDADLLDQFNVDRVVLICTKAQSGRWRSVGSFPLGLAD